MKAYTELIRHGGNQRLFCAIEMSVLAMHVDRPLHIHAEGLRGTGKTTILRAARDLLPDMQRICGCRYNCHPLQPHCPDHFNLSAAQVAAIGIEQVPMPFLEISPGAKSNTLTGSIDLTKLDDPQRPTASIMPGAIPCAHRGIIFVDDINRLTGTSADLADVLLDVMRTKPGKVQITASGFPTVQIPVQVSVWAASDPEQAPGPLEHAHRQLFDCFDMVIRTGPSTEMDVLEHILRQSQVYRVNPRQVICADPVTELWQRQQKFSAVGTVFDQVRMSEMIKNIIASIYLDHGLESLRAVEAMELGSRLHAALHNRRQVFISDLVAIVPLVLAHRVDVAALEDVLKYLDDAHFHQSTPTVPGEVGKKQEPYRLT